MHKNKLRLYSTTASNRPDLQNGRTVDPIRVLTTVRVPQGMRPEYWALAGFALPLPATAAVPLNALPNAGGTQVCLRNQRDGIPKRFVRQGCIISSVLFRVEYYLGSVLGRVE